MRNACSIATLGFTLILTGCNQAWLEVTPISQKPISAKNPDCEIVVLSQMPTDKKYEELCIINASSGKPLNKMLPEIKAKACAMGADAIVIKSSTLPNGKEAAQVLVVAIKYL